MNHQQATQLAAVERYLLDELTPSQRDEFEEHYFGCPECAADLSATAAFLEAAKKEFQQAAQQSVSPAAAERAAAERAAARSTVPERAAPRVAVPEHAAAKAAAARPSWFGFLRAPAFLSPAFALLLVIVVYQNVVQYPHGATEVAQLKQPEILASLSLVGANSRGGALPSVSLRPVDSFVMSLDIPTDARFSSYDCALVLPSGATVWNLRVAAQLAKDTVSIRVPPADWKAGDYTVVVRGNAPESAAGTAVDLADYHFTLISRE